MVASSRSGHFPFLHKSFSFSYRSKGFNWSLQEAKSLGGCSRIHIQIRIWPVGSVGFLENQRILGMNLFPTTTESVHGIDMPEPNSRRRGIAREEKIYVALGNDVAKNKSTLNWALQNTQCNKICIIHVHQPPRMIPVCNMVKKFQASAADGRTVYEEKKRKETEKKLDEYVCICRRKGVQAEKLCIEMDSVVKGILQLISQHNVKKLVMGAASDKHYSRRMTGLRSEKAIFVDRRAPDTCHIWFTCKGHLIYTREATKHDLRTLSTLLSEFQSIPVAKSTNSVQELEPGGFFNGQSGRVLDESLDTEKDERASSISSSSLLSCKLSYAGRSDVSLSQFEKYEGTESAPGLSNVKEISNHSSCPSIPEEAVPEKVCDQIQKAISEAHSSKREALVETSRRQEAEKEALDASRRAKEYKTAYYVELKRRREAELASANEKEEHEKIISLFVDHIEENERTVKELRQKCDSTLEWLERVMIERDELEIERDIARGEAEELRRRAEASALFIFCETVTENHPDLIAEVPEVLNPVRASSGGSSSFYHSGDESQKAPPCFNCPISHEVMRDPLVAADGYTYEAEAIRRWLKEGKHTSPMTNEKLSDTRLVPNRTLRSAIQEWLQQCRKLSRDWIHSEMHPAKSFLFSCRSNNEKET